MQMLFCLLLCFFVACPAATVFGREFSSLSLSHVLLNRDQQPNEIAVDFDRPMDFLLVKIHVIDQAGVDHSISRPIIRSDHRRISVEVGGMRPGIFTVQWGIVEFGGQRTEGTYTFELRTEEILSGAVGRRTIVI